MVGSPALLLLLALGLCCPGIHGQRDEVIARFRDGSTKNPQLGQRLELECVTFKEDSGVSWVRQDKAGTLHFIVHISSMSQTTFEGIKRTSTRFEARKHRRSIYGLVVKSFTSQDEGHYFCFSNSNQMLSFSRGQPVFFPVKTTAAPTTPETTTQSGLTKKEPCLETLHPETSEEKELNLSCDIFIWLPLASTCLLLLIALAVTVTLCQQNRRRRCRCKRPVNRKPNAKPSTSS